MSATPFYYISDDRSVCADASSVDPPPSYSSTASTVSSLSPPSSECSPRLEHAGLPASAPGIADAEALSSSATTAFNSSIISPRLSSTTALHATDPSTSSIDRPTRDALGRRHPVAGSMSTTCLNGSFGRPSTDFECTDYNSEATASVRSSMDGYSVGSSGSSGSGSSDGYIRTLGSAPRRVRSASALGNSPTIVQPQSSTSAGASSRHHGYTESDAVPLAASTTPEQHESQRRRLFHIHHHYHHPSEDELTGQVSAETSPDPANEPTPTSNWMKGKQRSSQDTSLSWSSLSSFARSRSARALHNFASSASCDSPDYAVPLDGPFDPDQYRTGAHGRKLASKDLSYAELPMAIDTARYANHTSRRRMGWQTPLRRLSDGVPISFNGPAGAGSSNRGRDRRVSLATFIPFPSFLKTWNRFLMHPLVPTQPLTLLFAIGMLAAFIYSLTAAMSHALSPEKVPRPWRQYCQEQRSFPHELADSLSPVDVFVGVFSVDAAYERRHLIRSTYLRHSRPIDPYTGKPGHNVQLKFILGRPRRNHVRRIALEMETYNDIVVLDVKENLNQGKTYDFFKWASENATVPIWYKAPAGKRIGALTPIADKAPQTYSLGFKKADYVVKADDDAFLILSELERHLRVAPRQATYWGYLIRNLFMGGECYALSMDLVNYIATDPSIETQALGKEDKRVAKWMRMHPNASTINWVTERCYVYDHPKATTAYAHGFLFPDEVERIRQEGKTGISTAEKARRGGESADSYSTVSNFKKSYSKPNSEMTMEEEVEALIEGGGRWSAVDDWTNKLSTEKLLRWGSIVFDHVDARIKGALDKPKRAEAARAEHVAKTDLAFGKYNRMPNSLLRDPGDTDIRPQHAKRGDEDAEPDDSDALLTHLDRFNPFNSTEITAAPVVAQANGRGYQFPFSAAPGYRQRFSQMPDTALNTDAYKQRAVAAPSLRYDPQTMSLREKRFLGLPYGGTVVVHYLKRNEWFLETALAILGRERTWDTGTDVPAYPDSLPPLHSADGLSRGKPAPKFAADHGSVSPMPLWNGKGEVELVSSQWGGARMYGSPLVKDNGYVQLGRVVPWDALEQSAEQKYGKYSASPKMRYADPPQTSNEGGDASATTSMVDQQHSQSVDEAEASAPSTASNAAQNSPSADESA